jgi:putative transposase
MSYVNIRVHCVWGTKNRQPLLVKEKRIIVMEHILQNAFEKGIAIDTLNGYDDHLHVLIRLQATQCIAETMQLIKGEAAFWANTHTNLFGQKFRWADEYYAASVSESQVEKVRVYIRNQELHHRKATFEQECEAMIKKYGFTYET